MAGARSVFESYLLVYRRTWRGSVLGSFVLPLLFMVGFGFGVGHYVDAAGRLGPVRYLDYIVPGQVGVTAFNIGTFESLWPVLSGFMWSRTFHSLVATPLRVADIVAGDLLFILFRLLTSTGIFLLVAALFGAVHSAWAVAVPLVCALLGLAAAAPTHAFSARLDNESYFSLLIRFGLIPLSLLSGIYFPVSALPAVVQPLAYASPLWHATLVCRAATLPGAGLSPLAIAGHLAYLAAWLAVGFWLAVRAYRRRLVT
jgi:lipooligosaccharide transport system permease protein